MRLGAKKNHSEHKSGIETSNPQANPCMIRCKVATSSLDALFGNSLFPLKKIRRDDLKNNIKIKILVKTIIYSYIYP